MIEERSAEEAEKNIAEAGLFSFTHQMTTCHIYILPEKELFP